MFRDHYMPFFFLFFVRGGGEDFGKITTWFSGGIEEGLVVALRVQRED